MQGLLNKAKSLSETEIIEILNKDFSVEELIELLEALFALDPKIKTEEPCFDCCGTGGDKSNTFNISTTSAIVAASLGIKICKNGGRSSSSKTGSIDVLEELGLDLKQSFTDKLIGLKKYNLAFHHSKLIAETLSVFKNIARKHKISSFLSLLGPFTNPFYLQGQIIGVGKEKWFTTMTSLAQYICKKQYSKRIALIQAKDSQGQIYDELISLADAKLRIIDDQGFFDYEFRFQDHQLTQAELEDLEGGENHFENAKILLSILDKQAHACKEESVLLNCALLKTITEKNLTENNFTEKFQNNIKSLINKVDFTQVKNNWLRLLSIH